MSDIQFVLGTIGSGKSFATARYRCLELRRSERMIVTNLSGWYGHEEGIPAGKLSLAEWCHIYIGEPVDIQSRVYLLDDSEVYEFFRYYPSGDYRRPHVMPMRDDVVQIAGKKDSVIKLPDLNWRQQLQVEGKMRKGCLFIIDEAHLYFDARKWQRSGTSVMHYMSQLRKLNDDIILVSQNPEKIDKNFRRDVTEVIWVKNCAKANYSMGVKFPGKIKLFKFRFLPTRTDKPESTLVIKLKDERYEDTYDTMAGVGLSGTMDPEEVPKGGHWLRWVWAGIVVLFAIIMGPRIMMNTIGKTVGGFMSQFHAGVASRMGRPGGMVVGGVSVSSVPQGSKASVGVANGGVPAVADGMLEKVLRTPVTLPGPVYSQDVFWSGVSRYGGDVHVLLSDGGSYRVGDGHVQGFGPHSVLVDGVFYRWLTPGQRQTWESLRQQDMDLKRRGYAVPSHRQFNGRADSNQ